MVIFGYGGKKSFNSLDNQKKSISIPAVESKKDSADIRKLLPTKPLNSNNSSINPLNVPKISNNLNLLKKEFSMFPQEEFGNPGELYVKQVNKNYPARQLCYKVQTG